MDAATILFKFRQRGFVLKPVGGRIFITPKKLLNDALICFVKNNKDQLLTALYDELDAHKKRKNILGDRMIVLRNFIKATYGSQWRYDKTCLAELDDILDETLIKYNYDLELAIDCWRPLSKSTPELASKQCRCGYVPPFCSCFT